MKKKKKKNEKRHKIFDVDERACGRGTKAKEGHPADVSPDISTIEDPMTFLYSAPTSYLNLHRKTSYNI